MISTGPHHPNYHSLVPSSAHDSSAGHIPGACCSMPSLHGQPVLQTNLPADTFQNALFTLASSFTDPIHFPLSP